MCVCMDECFLFILVFHLLFISFILIVIIIYLTPYFLSLIHVFSFLFKYYVQCYSSPIYSSLLSSYPLTYSHSLIFAHLGLRGCLSVTFSPHLSSPHTLSSPVLFSYQLISSSLACSLPVCIIPILSTFFSYLLIFLLYLSLIIPFLPVSPPLPTFLLPFFGYSLLSFYLSYIYLSLINIFLTFPSPFLPYLLLHVN